MDMEWKICPRFPEYEVSNCGDLRRHSAASRPGQKLYGIIDPDGYVRYSLRNADGSKTSATAHRLVAEAFLGPAPSENHQVAHNNGSRLLNIPNNLRWATCLENQHDRIFHGNGSIGVGNGRATITDDDVRYIRKRYFEIKVERGDVSELDNKFGLSRSQIIRIARKQAWRHVND